MTIDWKALAEAQRDAYLTDLQTFLAINSVEDMETATDGRPFGRGVAQALQFMLDKGTQDGFAVRNLDGYAGTIDLGAGADPIGILAHVDVVPAGDGWTTPPFKPSIRDGRIYARGAIDDKGPLLAAYYGMRIVRDLGLSLTKPIRYIVGTDEESGWLCMKYYGEHDTFPEAGFSPDAEFPIVHAEKGQINPTLSLQGPVPKLAACRLLHLASGGRVNMVPDQAQADIEWPGADLDDVRRRLAAYTKANQVKGEVRAAADDTLSIVMQGKAAHGMIPHEGINAGLKLARFLHDLPFEGTDAAYLQFLAQTLHGDFYGEQLNIACEDDVTGKLTVNAGILAYDGIGATGTVQLNIRYPATHKSELSIDLLKARVAELGWTVTQLRTSRSHHVPKELPLIRTLQRVYTEQTGKPAELLTTGGATYARSMTWGVAFGAAFPGQLAVAHMRDEYAIIDDLIRAMSLYAQAIYELAS